MNISEALKGTIRNFEIKPTTQYFMRIFEAAQKGTFDEANVGILYASGTEKTRLSKDIIEAVGERISKLFEITRRDYQRFYPSGWKTPAALAVGLRLQGVDKLSPLLVDRLNRLVLMALKLSVFEFRKQYFVWRK